MSSIAGFDSADHQTAYIFTASDVVDDAPARPSKKRKIVQQKAAIHPLTSNAPAFGFEKLLNGAENPQAVNLRQELFESCWSEIETRIQSVLDEANEGTLAEVILFVESSSLVAERTALLPTGFIVTGPNIASQELLFSQLSVRLKVDINGPAVLLRSGDTSNLKTALKQVIRDATNQKYDTENEGEYAEQYGRKLLNYDLDILHKYVKAHGCQAVVVVFQDSEAFDNDLLAELIKLFSSWSDRIPFVLLFGIATSLALFHERLSRSASRLLSGAQFDVENTSVVLERIFKKTVTGAKVDLRISTTLVSSMMTRQKNHVQSVQSFTTALKYAYMCHFYSNALSILNDVSKSIPILTNQHLEAVRMLPSFRLLVKSNLDAQDPAFIRGLLEDDEVLIKTIKAHLTSEKKEITLVLRVMHLLATISPEPVQAVELYKAAFEGRLGSSDFLQRTIDSTKRMGPDEILVFLKRIEETIGSGCPDMELDGWTDDVLDHLRDLAAIAREVTLLVKDSAKTGNPVRSSYAIHSKGLRTTVIAQRVQLSYEQSKLSKQDQTFTTLVEKLCTVLGNLLTCPNPQDLFLHEVWLYDSTSPYEDVFTPRPRHAVERALTTPHDYLNCACCKPDEGLSATQPATASMYQMYLQAGSLVNIADLWSTFLDNQNQNDEEDFDEREAVVRFYQGLVDLKLLGMVKQSKKKVDHLAKVLWEGL